jgi:hypothetical protein
VGNLKKIVALMGKEQGMRDIWANLNGFLTFVSDIRIDPTGTHGHSFDLVPSQFELAH